MPDVVQLAHDSYAQHLILDHINSFGRHVFYSDQTDPCIEHTVAPNLKTLPMLPKISKYLGVEVVELTNALGEYNLGELQPLAKTVRFSSGY